jgi:hypothetical protein
MASKTVIFVTPKAYTQLLRELGEDGLAKMNVQATPYIYMNMGAGWTEEECANIAYIVEVDCEILNRGLTFIKP